MAGIGFILQRLTRRDDLAGLATAYMGASLIAAGPWLFTIISLGGVNLFAASLLAPETIALFRIITIYNFAFSLIIAGPFTLTLTRRLADLIFVGRTEEAPAMLLAALAINFTIQAAIGIPFYFLACTLTPVEATLAVMNFFVIGGIWIVSVFLSALKDYGSITRIFGLGMFLAFAGALALGLVFDGEGLLAGFGAGMGIILFSLIARVLVEYPYRLTAPFAFLRLLRTHWELPLCGFIYNLAIWVDKFVMWSGPEHEVQARALISYPPYDSAMFLAYLTIVPGMTVFLVNVETRFFVDYARFYRDILEHATYDRIQDNHRSLITGLVHGLRNISIVQSMICFAFAVLAPLVLDFLAVDYGEVGMFRFGVLGALCHAMLVFSTVILSYFDLRRPLLFIYCCFLALNAGLTALTLHLGHSWYGYGYFMTTAITLVVGYVLTSRAIGRLPYLTFIANNPSLRPAGVSTGIAVFANPPPPNAASGQPASAAAKR